ncbi:MAG: 16S rRNA (uracil(1498)-N(3))-methyltransferase [Pseudomonadota bacterium]
MAHIPRLFVDQSLAAGVACRLPDGQAKYLTRVMRLGAGAHVRVFNGRDGEWDCALDIAGREVSIVPTVQTRPQESGPALTLLFAPLKKTRTDFVIEKASELGVSVIQPVITDYTQAQRVRSDRLRAVAIEAAEQTERMDVPQICDALPLGKALAGWAPDKQLIYCDEASDARPLTTALRVQANPVAGLLIGPEGGFSLKERNLLRAQAHITPVTLGPRILRAETAVVAALALWQSELGDWRERPYVPATDILPGRAGHDDADH